MKHKSYKYCDYSSDRDRDLRPIISSSTYDLRLYYKQRKATYSQTSAAMVWIEPMNLHCIAREIHDSLGHALTAQSIQLNNAIAF